jgi:hypothetical protein
VLENRPPLRPLRGANDVQALLDQCTARGVGVGVGLERKVPPNHKVQENMQEGDEDQADEGSDDEHLTIASALTQPPGTGTAIAARAQEQKAQEPEDEAHEN